MSRTEGLDDVLEQRVLAENRAACLALFLVVLNPLATDTWQRNVAIMNDLFPGAPHTPSRKFVLEQ